MAHVLMVAPDESLLAALRGTPLLAGHAVDTAAGGFDALRCLRRRPYAVLVSSPCSLLEEDLAQLGAVRAIRPGIRVVLLGRHSTPEAVIEALRSRVFAVFSPPFAFPEIADMVARAIDAVPFSEGVEVVSARSDWITVRVDCRQLNAERLVNFFTELRRDVPEQPREDLMLAFREVLMNAMEHGCGFDAERAVEVTAVRTQRTLVFYVRDPGPGFDVDDVPHSALHNAEDEPLAHAAVRSRAGLRPGGFGLLLARRVVDEMLHSERGNEVLLIKHLE